MSEPTKQKNVVLRRVLVAVWGIPLLIVPTILGGWYFAGLFSIIAAIAVFEYVSMLNEMGTEVPRLLIAMLAGIFVLLVQFHQELVFEFILVCMILIPIVLLRGGTSSKVLQIFGTLGGFLYIAGSIAQLCILRKSVLAPTEWWWGGVFIIYLFSTIWICDSCAYFGGKRFGKHKLASTISPGKTIEGAIFGLLGALVWSLVGIAVLGDKLPVLFLVLTALMGGTVGQAGDLIESAIKRNAGVKDSGHLLPEHGGVFDRFDSLLLTTPAVYLLTVWFLS